MSRRPNDLSSQPLLLPVIPANAGFRFDFQRSIPPVIPANAGIHFDFQRSIPSAIPANAGIHFDSFLRSRERWATAKRAACPPFHGKTRLDASLRWNEGKDRRRRAGNGGAPVIWAVIPAAGRSTRFGGDIPKQYLLAAGQPLIAHALLALLAHPRVAGAMVALAAEDERWPGWTSLHGKPVLLCTGGGERADSVLAALRALPHEAGQDALVLVHDAARPNLHQADLDRLIAAAEADADGAILAAPVRDTLKRADAAHIIATEPRDGLWRAFTPQAFRRGALIGALQSAQAAGLVVTDEAMAMERVGARPRLVEGREDNLKVTTPADLALADYLLSNK